jgi:site-specific recombinase XerD
MSCGFFGRGIDLSTQFLRFCRSVLLSKTPTLARQSRVVHAFAAGTDLASRSVMAASPKLLDRVREAIRTRHYSRRTEEAYVHWIRRFIVFHKLRHPSTMGADDIAAFLTWLAVRQHVSASTQNQALSALLFLYRRVLHMDVGAIEHVPRARTPERVPVVLSRDEVRQVMRGLSGTPWLVVALLYGAGLRLQECLELRVKDIDVDRHQIVVCRGKGQKDRRTMLPVVVEARLIAHLKKVKQQHERDAIRLRRICLRTGTTSGRCRSCSGMPMSARQ